MHEDDFYNAEKVYDHQRGEVAGRIIVALWLFCSGGAAGWILRRIVE